MIVMILCVVLGGLVCGWVVAKLSIYLDKLISGRI